ncbi:MAG: hypothetical protein CSA18_02430 [Deltaproteobacteria bacterium]|nr:MAG: hypothetical protein CSB21_01035 [Deltaproteobacteria bacterium]PIE74984.1 MAG: hypothetical protein CSA18_02430 [Deltaproteobacteria bacterium]
MKSFKILLIFILTLFFSAPYGFANSSNAVISKINGDVFILKKGAFRKSFAIVSQVVKDGDMIITGDKSYAVLKLSDNSNVVIEENSRMKSNALESWEQKEGKAYFNIEKKEQKGFKVKTPFAVIGVKGTEFIIDSSEKNKTIALKKGLIDVESLKKEFELRRKKELSAFQAFMEKTRSAFGKYKKADREEFVEFVRSFELKPGKMVVFSDNIAEEKAFTDNLDEDFKKFREMI